MLGSLDSHDDVCAEICEGADIAVVAVHYRLSPENIFPAAFDDCWSALKHVAETELGVDRAKIIVGGDSAGGNLAAALAMKARDDGSPKLLGQVLIYPGLGGDTSKGSYVAQATAPGLTVADIDYYRRLYCGPDGSLGHASKYAAPLRETDYRGLPPAFMVAAALDPLHDDCSDYAARLQAAGVPALVRDEPLLVHAFIRARHMSESAAREFQRHRRGLLRARLSRRTSRTRHRSPSGEPMKTVTDFPRKVKEIENLWIPLSDGIKLAARMWIPEDAEEKPVPAILEYLPYRKRDGTIVRDALTHPYFAGHGYAAIRVDMRGNGDSEG